jgi:MFS family permease
LNPATRSIQGVAARGAFASITTLFFAWGFITVTVDPLIASLKAIFELSYAEVMLTQFAFFMAYGIVSLPAAMLVARLGYPRSIILALGIMIAGCLCVPLATHLDTFAVVLAALFIIASGITILQVAANPLAALLGPARRSHFRLTLSQAFNSLGTAIAPYLVSSVILAGGMFAVQGGLAVTAAQRTESLRHIDFAFLVIAALIGLLALFIWSVRARLSAASAGGESEHGGSLLQALRSGWAVLGAAAIFLYVGAEVSRGSVDRQHHDELPASPGRIWRYSGTRREDVEPVLGWGDGRSIHRQCAADACSRLVAARYRGGRSRDAVLDSDPGAGRICRLGGTVDRGVQFHHVSGDIHPHARALDRLGRRHLGAAVHGDRRWRGTAAAGGKIRRCGRTSRRLRGAADRLRVHQRLRNRGHQGKGRGPAGRGN